MATKINVGVVGCGYWGPNLIRNFASLHDARLRAVCDLNVERLKHIRELYPNVEGYTDYARFLSEGKLDAVVVATSVGLHHPMAKAALEAGKHVLVEKPLAKSSAECADLIDVANRKGLTLMVGHTFLYSSVVRRIKQIVDTGDIGEIRYICARRLNLGLFQKDINVAWDLAPHDLSIILHIFGEVPHALNCTGSATVSPRVHDITTMWLGFSKNRSAIVQSSWLDPRKTREMTIVGSRRMIVYDDTAPLEKIRVFDTRVESPPHYDTFAEFHYAYHYGDQYVPYVKQEEPLKVECQHFIDCIRYNHKPISHGQQAMDLVRILEASTRSLELNGSRVELSITPGPSAPAPTAETNGNGNGSNGANGSHPKANGTRATAPSVANGSPGSVETSKDLASKKSVRVPKASRRIPTPARPSHKGRATRLSA